MESSRKRRRQNTVTARFDDRLPEPSDSSDYTDSTDMYGATFEDESDSLPTVYAPLSSEEDTQGAAGAESPDQDADLLDVDAMDIDVEHAIQPTEAVGGMPWARTNPELRALGLCVIENNKILSCLICREHIVLLTVKDAPSHVRGHREPTSRKPTIAEMLVIIRRHDVHEDNVRSI
jgi:hypothetical protein